jgi:hypothetical protein
VRAFLASFCSAETSSEVINELFMKFVELLPRHPNIDENFFHILERIRNFLAINFEVQEINGSVETMTRTTFGSMLQMLAQEHYHTSIDGKHTCSFHPESLVTHLFSAMIYAYGNIPEQYTSQEKFICCLTALLHDIGKV